MMSESWVRILFLISSVVNLSWAAYYLNHYARSKDGSRARNSFREQFYKHGLIGMICGLEFIPSAAFRLIVMIVLFNFGMWHLVSYLRSRYAGRRNTVITLERVPN